MGAEDGMSHAQVIHAVRSGDAERLHARVASEPSDAGACDAGHEPIVRRLESGR